MNIRAIFQNVFTPEYIFDFAIMSPQPSDRYYMILGLLMVIVGAGFKLISNFSHNPITRTLWHRLASPLVVGGILEIVWFTARDQNIRFFGSHFLAWAIGIIVLIWIYFPIRYYFGRYKEDKVRWEKQQIKLKYIK